MFGTDTPIGHFHWIPFDASKNSDSKFRTAFSTVLFALECDIFDHAESLSTVLELCPVFEKIAIRFLSMNS